jgi:hypothetical protein
MLIMRYGLLDVARAAAMAFLTRIIASAHVGFISYKFFSLSHAQYSGENNMASPIKNALKEAEKSPEKRSVSGSFNEGDRLRLQRIETRLCTLLNHFEISAEVEREKQWVSPYNATPFTILDRTRLARLETRLCTLMSFLDVPLTSYEAKRVKEDMIAKNNQAIKQTAE